MIKTAVTRLRMNIGSCGMTGINSQVRRIYGRLFSVAYNWYTLFFTWQTTVRGTLQNQTTPVQVLLVMDRNGRTERDLLRRLFGDNWEKTSCRRVCLLRVRRYGKRLPANIAFCVLEIPKFWAPFMAGAFQFELPEFVRQTLDLTGGITAVKSRIQSSRRRSTFNQIAREKKFSYRLANTAQDIENFYHNMYVPHVREQFGSAAWLSTLERMKSRADAQVFYVNDGTRDVAGELIAIRDGTLFRFNNGVVSGQTSQGWHDAGNALYAQAILFGIDRGLRKMDMGLSRPFLNDGVYLYKRSWGAGVELDPLANATLYFANPGNSEGARAFLEMTPMAVFAQDGMVAQCHFGSSIAEIDRGQTEKSYRSPGLKALLLNARDGQTMHPFNFANEGHALTQARNNPP